MVKRAAVIIEQRPYTILLVVAVGLLFVWYVFFHFVYASSSLEQDVLVTKSDHPYLDTLLQHKQEDRMFPYRLLCDENRNLIPVVALAAFFRTPFDRERFDSYTEAGVHIVGITAYKTFPKPISDKSGDSDTMNDDFPYTEKIKNWIYCFNDPSLYDLNPSRNHLIEMSESDFYDPVEPAIFQQEEKKYDFIYSCLRDVDNDDDPNPCPKEGWNAINRNFNLALACLPIMIQEFGFKILIVGRVNCGLEGLYGDKLEIVDMLPYHDFQKKIRQSRCLFVPNIYDASPRVVAEAMVNDVPVLMNRSIVCGSKYINDRTGLLFTDEHDIRYSLRKMQQVKYSPRSWWAENYGVKQSGKKFRDYLAKCYPQELTHVKEVYFY